MLVHLLVPKAHMGLPSCPSTLNSQNDEECPFLASKKIVLKKLLHRNKTKKERTACSAHFSLPLPSGPGHRSDNNCGEVVEGTGGGEDLGGPTTAPGAPKKHRPGGTGLGLRTWRWDMDRGGYLTFDVFGQHVGHVMFCRNGSRFL